MKKNDIILICFVTILCIGSIGYLFLNKEEGTKVIITVDGIPYQEAELSKNQTIDIKTEDHVNVLVIEDGYAKMFEADCPDQICVHQKRINKKGESIVCMPHKIVVTVVEGEPSKLDGVAN